LEHLAKFKILHFLMKIYVMPCRLAQHQRQLMDVRLFKWLAAPIVKLQEKDAEMVKVAQKTPTDHRLQMEDAQPMFLHAHVVADLLICLLD
jgi:hypothetical protein